MRLLLLCALSLCACTDEADTCSGGLEAFPAPLYFGDLYPADAPEEERVPRQKTVVLQKVCGGQLEITAVCILEDAHDGKEGEPAFELEGPDRSALGAGDTAGIRVTFEHTDANLLELPVEGRPEPVRDHDRALLVVETQTEAKVVVPLCARLIPSGTAPEDYDCAPVTEGERASTCGD